MQRRCLRRGMPQRGESGLHAYVMGSGALDQWGSVNSPARFRQQAVLVEAEGTLTVSSKTAAGVAAPARDRRQIL